MSLHRHLRPDTDAALALPALPLTIYNDYSDANKTRKYSTPVNEIEYPNKSTQIWKNTVAIASVSERHGRGSAGTPFDDVGGSIDDRLTSTIFPSLVGITVVIVYSEREGGQSERSIGVGTLEHEKDAAIEQARDRVARTVGQRLSGYFVVPAIRGYTTADNGLYVVLVKFEPTSTSETFYNATTLEHASVTIAQSTNVAHLPAILAYTDFEDECSYELSIVCAIPLLAPVNQFPHSPMGRIYNTKDKLLRERQGYQLGVFFAIQYLQWPSNPLTTGQSDVRSLHRGFKTKALARLLTIHADGGRASNDIKREFCSMLV
ncbi:hypothetical protein EDD85DRAFT_794466 [Armillaria nabsnona]|nr:hypothetical protein EDD85DRAFT_794466 [Armillaria nabsnona]